MESRINLGEVVEERSFSFSSLFDFNSSLVHVLAFSDNDNSDDEYIEIAFETAPTMPTPNHKEEGEEEGNIKEELEFSLSFSSSLPFPGFSASCSPTTCPGSGDTTGGSEVVSGNQTSKSSGSGSSSNRGRVSFPAVNGVVDMMLSVLKGGSSTIPIGSTDESVPPHHTRKPKTNWDLVKSRFKASNVSSFASSNGSGVRKFLVKFRSIRAWSSMLVKLRRVMSPTAKEKTKTKTTTTTTSSTNKILIRRSDSDRSSNHPPGRTKQFGRRRKSSQKNGQLQSTGTSTKNINTCGNGCTQKSGLEIKLDTISWVLEGLSKNVNIGRKAKQTRSCPVCIKSSSAIHQSGVGDYRIYARDNSVQAAIAHCKKSFAPDT